MQKRRKLNRKTPKYLAYQTACKAFAPSEPQRRPRELADASLGQTRHFFGAVSFYKSQIFWTLCRLEAETNQQIPPKRAERKLGHGSCCRQRETHIQEVAHCSTKLLLAAKVQTLVKLSVVLLRMRKHSSSCCYCCCSASESTSLAAAAAAVQAKNSSG